MNKKPVSLALSGLIVLSNIHYIEKVYANEKNTNYNQISLKDNNSIIQIPNVDLKDAICKELKLSSSDNITAKQLEGITNLTLNGKNISNLEGIQYCKNLKNLSIIKCNLKDISLLSYLTNLETLKLDENKIENIFPLSNLKNLKTLTLSSNYISDVSPLSNLTNLKELNLSDNCILDLRPLSNIKDKLGKNVEFEYQTIYLDPIKLKDDKKVVMEIPKVYDVDGTLLEKPSKYSDAGDHEIVESTVVWSNVIEGSTLEIVFENKDKTFDVSICQEVIRPVTDIKGHWAEEAINNFINKGYIHGYEDSTFRPDNSITRAEFITIFNKYFGLTNTSGKSFTDTANHWAKNEIDIAITNNIIVGFEDKTFRPDEPMTREQAALIISNYKKLQNNNLNNISKYSDSNNISSWAKNAVEAMLENGYIYGYSDNTLKAKNNLTRAEAVTLLSRIK